MAQDSLKVFQLDNDIVITANRIPTAFSDVARTVTVIRQNEIRQIAAQSVPELLESIAGVNTKQRGTHGMQADISIRGAGFEQTLILIDGLKLTDPQTGHHNSNLPVHISDIARIEVLKGPGSRLYGPNAFGGVINIITKKSDKIKAIIGGSYGENNLYGSNINLFSPLGESTHRLTISKSGSDGYRPNTDFQNLVFSQNSVVKIDGNALELSSGYNQKDFGANSFYTTSFPEQYEETRLLFIQSSFHYKKKNFSIKPQAYYRHHKDDFVLKRSNPAFYHNIHKTNVYGLEISGHYNSSFGITLFGGEWVEEEIESNNLNNHSRHRNGLFVQQQLSFKPFVISAGASAFYYSNEGWRAWPGIDLLYRASENTKFYVSVAQGFRVPTYTELYYKGGGLSGNSKLKAEESLNYELGFSWANSNSIFELALFRRENDNLIDYVQNDTDNIFYARNFTSTQTNGIETKIKISNILPLVKSIFMNYNYLDSDLDLSGKTTKYALTHFKHQFIAGTDYLLFWDGLVQSWKFRYEDSLVPAKQTIVDTRISWQEKGFHIYFDINNIFDEKYEDIPGVPMPGRWFKAGFEINILGEE